MQYYTYVIIGGGIAGTTAAETIRKNDPVGSIAIVSDEPHNCYSRVLLSKPKWVLGEQPFENVWLKSDAWYRENNIHLFKGIRATELQSGAKIVTLSDGDSLQYKKLLLATGAHSRKWDVKGSDKKGIYYLRTVDDATAISEVAQGEPKRVIMIGSACVSFEIIEILHSRGFTVTEVMRERYFFEPQLSPEEVAPIEKMLEEKGIEIVREVEVAEVLGDTQVTGVRLSNGREIPCDIILPFIGVELPVGWIQKAGVATHKGIYANQFLETNVPDVWTAGDTTECWDSMLEETVIMGNWMSARLQGEIAGKNMSNATKEPFAQVSFHTSHGFGFQIGWTGDVRALEDRIVIHYPTPLENSHCRIIIAKGKVMGGTTVNRPDLMGAITKLIKAKVDMSDKLEGLRDGTVDIKTLVAPVVSPISQTLSQHQE
ncbi:MAG: Nitrite reductase (NAD(P)H) [Parcubacteria group bacterium GW2011_GWA2_43_11]|nr:MAG: Nitrite reductase (NAD(P)H) [Parcubacteria group bacterium GW2011_GWC2_42_11]KKS85945.1 MAG: Nitrite reductase (NAD(P)H) [Parcubacteria group bacterium GW2011_GWA2_43_11]